MEFNRNISYVNLTVNREYFKSFFLSVAHPVKKNSYFFIRNKHMDCVCHPKECMASI